MKKLIFLMLLVLPFACHKTHQQGAMSTLVYEPEKPKLIFDETHSPEIGSPASRTWLSFAPLMKDQGNASFNFTQGSTVYGPWQPDEVFMMGWNFNPGGGPMILGQPGIGLSFEQHYKPTGQELGLTEHHTFWIRPDGHQTRLASYTIDNLLNYVDYYQTLSHDYLKSPIDDHVYKSTNLGANGEVIESFSGQGSDYQWTYDVQGLQLTTASGKPFFFRGPLYVEMPGGTIFHQKYVQFDRPVIFNGGVTFKHKVIFEGGFENRKP